MNNTVKGKNTDDVIEWLELIKEAKKLGIADEEIRSFFRSFKNKSDCKLPT